jgi:predicted SAM-dependent methyltransferase
MNWRASVWETRTLVTRSRLLAPAGLAALKVLSWTLRHNPLQLIKPSVRNGTYLNAGCGKRPRQGFVNLDFIWQPGVDLLWDLNWRLPFADKSLMGIYSEHCLEHLPFDLVTGHVLREFLRVLQPGKRLRIIVPDGGLYLKLYTRALEGEPITFPHKNESLTTPMMQVNRCFRDHGHLFAYDFDTFRHFLLKVGFSAVELRSFLSGGDSMLLLDSEERAPESLYLEAVR